MPPQLASQFTTGELAALRIVADAVRDRGACMLTLGRSRRGPGCASRRRAMRCTRRRTRSRHHRGAPAPQATEPRQCGAGRLARMAFLDRARAEKFERRPRKRHASASQGGGCKKMESTDKTSSRSLHGDRVSRGQHAPCQPQKPQKAAFGLAERRGSAAHWLSGEVRRRGSFDISNGAQRLEPLTPSMKAGAARCATAWEKPFQIPDTMDLMESRMRRFTTVDLDENLGDVKAAASRAPIVITSMAKTAS